MKNLKEQVLEISRQSGIGKLSDWFDQRLDAGLGTRFLPEGDLIRVNQEIIQFLRKYSSTFNINNVVIGMSGGVDSALTAALFKNAGWTVHGVTMPIYQNPRETSLGQQAITQLGINGYNVDLSKIYNEMNWGLHNVDTELGDEENNAHAVLVRRGNVRARLRMITLYDLAAKLRGLVASTDNFSELASGFWTLHGDIGDLSPIQSLYKSWEVPMLAKLNGVPEEIWRANPTDGLGIDSGDESQFGFSYLELDIMLGELQKLHDRDNLRCYGFDKLKNSLKIKEGTRENIVFDLVTGRIKATWFKRKNPFNLDHPLELDKRYDFLETFDCHYSVSKLGA